MIGIDPDPCDNACKHMFVVDKQFIDHDEVKFPLYGAKFENGTIKPCPGMKIIVVGCSAGDGGTSWFEVVTPKISKENILVFYDRNPLRDFCTSMFALINVPVDETVVIKWVRSGYGVKYGKGVTIYYPDGREESYILEK
jgi:hypothetical protein